MLSAFIHACQIPSIGQLQKQLEDAKSAFIHAFQIPSIGQLHCFSLQFSSGTAFSLPIVATVLKS